MTADDEQLVKVLVKLPEEDEAPISGERFWAKPLGDNLYELRNVPFFAYDLHFNDVVRAIAPSPDRVPVVVEVVRRSGHRTVCVIFSPEITEDERARLIGTLHQMHATYERTEVLYAFDIEPEGDYEAICDVLNEWEQQELLDYETGTTRADDLGD